jgi:hypothetical protein
MEQTGRTAGIKKSASQEAADSPHWTTTLNSPHQALSDGADPAQENTVRRIFTATVFETRVALLRPTSLAGRHEEIDLRFSAAL